MSSMSLRVQQRFPELKLDWNDHPYENHEAISKALARNFQTAVVGHVVDKVGMALDYLENDSEGSELLQGKKLDSLVISGGVASNMFLRETMRKALERRSSETPLRLIYPPVSIGFYDVETRNERQLIRMTKFTDRTVHRQRRYDSLGCDPACPS